MYGTKKHMRPSAIVSQYYGANKDHFSKDWLTVMPRTKMSEVLDEGGV